MYVCMCSSVGTQIPAYTCALECRSQRSVLNVFLYSFSCYYSPLWLWRWHLTDLGYVDSARLAGSKSQESSCLCLVNARIAGTWHHSQVLREDLNTVPHACIASAFLTEPSPYSLYFLFWGRVSLFPRLSLSSLCSQGKPWLFTLLSLPSNWVRPVLLCLVQKTRARKCPEQSRVGRKRHW